MNVRVVKGLPFVSVTLEHNSNKVEFENVLLDTGSGGCIFSADRLDEAGIRPQPDAVIRQVVGIGGSESVLEIQLDQISAGSLALKNFVIESGSADYGFGFDGILGFDFLQQTGAIIDLNKMEIRSPED